MKNAQQIFFALLLVIFGILAGYVIGSTYEHNILVADLSMIHPIRENDPAYKFINPLLAYIIPGSDQEEDFRALKTTISNVVDAQKKKGVLLDSAVFLSDLNEGRWIGVNENQKFNPASMLKVVIMVTYFKEREKDANILTKKLQYTKDFDDLLRQDTFNAQSALQVGGIYTVDELIQKMIIDSDNGAEMVLLANINKSILDSLYGVLGIENPEDAPGNFTISPRQYSLFFRILYSATYLRKSMSEKALDLLSKTTFNEGLTVGVPSGVTVSHKFGEYVDMNGSQINSIELHDCGIVYQKDNPYFLCIMTKGKDLAALEEVIQTISRLAYQHYDSEGK